MARYDIKFQAYRRQELHRLRNLDPDDIVSELNIETDNLIDRLWEEIEDYIELNYEKEIEYGEDEEGYYDEGDDSSYY